MNINFVFREADHIPNTPKHILISNALNICLPKYCHLPLLLGHDRKKLSLRKEQGMNILTFKEKGYIPDAILNFVSLFGWSPKKNIKPIFTIKQLINEFDLNGLGVTNSIFDTSKLKWVSRQHIKLLTNEEKLEYCIPYLPDTVDIYKYPFLNRLLPILCERIICFSDINNYFINKDIDYFFNNDNTYYDAHIISSDIIKIISFIKDIPDDNFTIEIIKNKLQNIHSSNNIHPLEQMRRILAHGHNSIDPISITFILGKKESMERLNKFLFTR